MDYHFDKVCDLRLLAEGDMSDFKKIYSDYVHIVYKNVHLLVKEPHFCEEIVQDVFISLWQSRFKLNFGQSILGWLMVVSRNKSLDFLKRQLREPIDYVEDQYLLANSWSDNDDTEFIERQINQLEEAIESLPPRKKEVLKSCKIEELSIAEVARNLGISKETIKEYLKDSYKFIRAYFRLKNNTGR